MDTSNPKNPDDNQRIVECEFCLIHMYGVIIGGKDLRHILGYRTGDAFRQAVRHNRLPFPTFIPEGRPAQMVRTHDIARWLVSIDADTAYLTSNNPG